MAAGRLNRQKRKGLTADGRRRLQAAILKNQPWLVATGPTSNDGKARSALNGSRTGRGNRGVSAMRREMQAVAEQIGQMREARQSIRELLFEQ